MIHTCSGKTFVAGENNITEWYCLYLPRSWFYYSCIQKDLFSHQLEGWLSWGLFWTLTSYAYLPHYWQGWFLSGSFTLKEFTNHWGGWEDAEVIGKMVPSFPELQFGLLFYCPCENEEIHALRENQGNFDNPITFHRLLVNTLSGKLTISMIVINQSTGLNQT